MAFLLKPKSVLKIQLDIFDFKGLTRWTVLRVNRLGKILQFGLLFKGLGDFWVKILFVVGILRVKKGFDVLDF
jgi:hypothetical protein